MRYNPALPVAVFLGPSLGIDEARATLAANYYPPVRMGDIYRLLASGVRTIVIIDGVFHQSTPVWQREILSALEEGVEVVGGASMGALRAAELWPYGMAGVGTIFEWYRDGVIDGDDEVALLHTDHTLGYRALSEAMVNIRHNLDRALARGLLPADSHAALVTWAAQQYFATRGWKGLLQSPPCVALPSAVRDALATFVSHELVDLKRLDALRVLSHCATATRVRAAAPARSEWSYPGVARDGLQAAHSADGCMIEAQAIVAQAVSEPDWMQATLRAAVQRHFLDDWMNTRALQPPPAQLAAYMQTLVIPTAQHDRGAWLRANGITTHEYEHELSLRARCAWLCELDAESAARYECPPPATAEVLEALVPLCGHPPALARHELRVAALLADWAALHGVECPPQVNAHAWQVWQTRCPPDAPHLSEAARSAAAQAACADWLVQQGPAHFGHTQWSAERALLRELQLRGRCAELAQALAAHACAEETAQA